MEPLSAVSEHSKVAYAYLDPISWLAGLQIIGGGMGWLMTRLKRLRKAGVPDHVLSREAVVLDPESALRELRKQPLLPRLVLMIEGARDWPFLEPIVHAVCERESAIELWCLSASDLPSEGLAELRLTTKTVCATNPVEWRYLAAGINHATVLTTLTDLGGRAFPKARGEVCYMYAFHSLVSTHAVYKAAAFDAYDVILCAHSSHVAEIRERERQRGLKPKRLAETGYPYVDELRLRQRVERSVEKTVLIAPSWGSDGHLETTWPTVIEAFSQAGWKVIFRPHPESLKRSRGKLKAVHEICDRRPDVEFDIGAQAGAPLPRATCLVTDWSGAALELALAFEIPVGFVDTPQKVRNPFWTNLGLPTVEEEIRHRLGPVVGPSDVHRLPELMRIAGDRPRLASIEIFHPARSAEVTAEVVITTLLDAAL